MHSIKFVAQRTGLSAHTIRAWERRYGALSPERTEANRRLYSDEDIARLSLLREAVRAGHTISRVASLSLAELRGIVAQEAGRTAGWQVDQAPEATTPRQSQEYLASCLETAQKMDPDGLARVLAYAATTLGAPAVIEKVILPLLHEVGERWKRAELRPAQEHLVSAVVRTQLGRLLETRQCGDSAPRLVATTPVGQWHEFGAMCASVIAACEGWQVFYLGPNLPAEEIAGAAQRVGAKAVALSIVYPPDDARLLAELPALRGVLGSEMRLLVGGRGAAGYGAQLQAAGALSVRDIPHLRQVLERLRLSNAAPYAGED